MLRAIAHFAFIIYYSNYSFFMPGSRNFEEQTGCFAVIPGEVIAQGLIIHWQGDLLS